MRIKTSSIRTIKLLVRGKAGTASLFFPHSSCALNTEYFCLVSCLVSGPSPHAGVIKSSIKTPSFMHSGTAACLPHSLLAFHSPFQPIQWNINSTSDKCSLSYNTFLMSFCSCSGGIKKGCNIFQWVIETLSNPDICSVQGYLNIRGIGIGFSKIYPTKVFRKNEQAIFCTAYLSVFHDGGLQACWYWTNLLFCTRMSTAMKKYGSGFPVSFSLYLFLKNYLLLLLLLFYLSWTPHHRFSFLCLNNVEWMLYNQMIKNRTQECYPRFYWNVTQK